MKTRNLIVIAILLSAAAVVPAYANHMWVLDPVETVESFYFSESGGLVYPNIKGHTEFTLDCKTLKGEQDYVGTQSVDIAPIFQEL